LGISDSDRYLSVLPLAHVYARTLNWIALYWGMGIYYFNDPKNFSRVCQEIHPTFLVLVPRILEKLYAQMVTHIHQASFLKRTIGQFAFDLARQERENTWKKLFLPLAESLVYSQLRAAIGGALRIVITGGAPLDLHLYHFFIDIGLPIFQGWGLTEACPVTVNREGKSKEGSIGLPLSSDVEVKISPVGELLVRGSNVMRGYFQDTEATALTLDAEGWLHTGDIGAIDPEGYVSITGRFKEIFKTSTGETITPIPLEQALCQAPFIAMAMVIANNRKFVSCLLVPEFEVLKALKTQQGLTQLSDEAFLSSVYIRQETDKLIANVNVHLNKWEQIRAYRFIPHELTIERGELTPSMKVVRDVVEKRHLALVDAIYQEDIE
jgi:long-chain acyl-CoA synthetase